MSELKAITAYEANWKAESYGDNRVLVYLKSAADKVIAELKEERRWRKCSDEKPDLGDIVLVKLSERVKGHYFPMDVVRWDSTFELGEIEVSHWMPLPSAPKEEK